MVFLGVVEDRDGKEKHHNPHNGLSLFCDVSFVRRNKITANLTEFKIAVKEINGK